MIKNVLTPHYSEVPLPVGRVVVCSEESWLALNKAARISPEAVSELMDDPDFEGGHLAHSDAVNFG